ncbi:hypothetical protein ACF97O_000937 [Citrobacter koseri]|nr:hypothetical protein [Citrobacter koseri]
MHRIDTATAQVDKFGPGKNGFTNGDPATGRRATDLNSDMWDAVQEEICTVIESSGLALNKEEHDQLYEAIIKIITSKIPDALLKKNNLSDVANKAIALSNIGGVPSTRKVNNRALSSDITLTADDVGAIPTTFVGSIADGGSMANATTPGWWKITVPTPSSVAAFPKFPNGNFLYGYGYMFVEVVENTWIQHYYSHHGQNAKRQNWNSGPDTTTAWVTDYNTAYKPGAGDVGAYTKGESDNKFQPKGNYTPAGEAYTKAESDGRFQPKGSYTPAGQAYTKAESDSRFQKINTALKASNGWFKDTNTGLIFQFGTGSYSKGARVGFPVVFPTACVSVVGNDSGSGVVGTALGERTAYGFTMYSTQATVSLSWFAVGY